MPTACPTPRRVSHPNQETAHRQRVNDLLRDNATLYPYKCRCGQWHLTPNLDDELPTYQQASPEHVERLRRLDGTAFAVLVDADAKKTASIAERLALRHPDNLTRWRWALKRLQAEVRRQLASEEPDQGEWRAKAQYYGDVLSDRAAECQALRTATHANAA